jgi:hypothetical protein
MGFHIETERLLANLEALRKRLCAYGGAPCDCKFAQTAGDRYVSSEVTGCPEIYQAMDIIRAESGAVAELARFKEAIAPYAYHHPMCPAMREHRCTCGMAEVRKEIWGSDRRPAPEPNWIPDEAAPSVKTADRVRSLAEKIDYLAGLVERKAVTHA